MLNIYLISGKSFYILEGKTVKIKNIVNSKLKLLLSHNKGIPIDLDDSMLHKLYEHTSYKLTNTKCSFKNYKFNKKTDRFILINPKSKYYTMYIIN